MTSTAACIAFSNIYYGGNNLDEFFYKKGLLMTVKKNKTKTKVTHTKAQKTESTFLAFKTQKKRHYNFSFQKQEK